MRHVLPLLALGAMLVPATTLPAAAAPREFHVCPAEARGTVSHNGDSDWVATTQSSRVQDARVAPIGGIVALVCVYRMFGGDYWIYMRPNPDFLNCRPYNNSGERGFDCIPL